MSARIEPRVSQIFTTPVVSVDWSDNDNFNERMRQAILAREPQSPGVTRSNVGGWHSDNDLLTWSDPVIGEFIARLQKMGKSVLDMSIVETGTKRPYSLSFVAWANVLRNGDYHSVHDHPMAHWSGVYYVGVGTPSDDSNLNGRLELLDPRTGVNMFGMPDSAFATRCILDTHPGRMIFFPSWLKHVVHPFRGEGERIAISYNMTISPEITKNTSS